MAINKIMAIKSFSMSINGHETYIHVIKVTEVIGQYYDGHLICKIGINWHNIEQLVLCIGILKSTIC